MPYWASITNNYIPEIASGFANIGYKLGVIRVIAASSDIAVLLFAFIKPWLAQAGIFSINAGLQL